MNILMINSKRLMKYDLFSRLLTLIEERYQKKILRYHFWEDRQRSLLGHLLSRYAIMQQFHLNNDKIKLVENPYGKPHIKGYRAIHYNISHSGDWVVCAISQSVIGIDIQKFEGMKFGIIEHCFSKDERKYLFSLGKAQQLISFYDMWTLKEAYIKAIGKGLFQQLSEFSVLKDGKDFRLFTKEPLNKKFFFKKYSIEKGYSLSVCSQENNFCAKLEELFIDDLIKRFNLY